jgi:hypothetical protein
MLVSTGSVFIFSALNLLANLSKVAFYVLTLRLKSSLRVQATIFLQKKCQALVSKFIEFACYVVLPTVAVPGHRGGSAILLHTLCRTVSSECASLSPFHYWHLVNSPLYPWV